NPDLYFPTKELRELGYMRKQCSSCRTFFWTTHEDRKVCGDPSCSGGFNVAGNPLSNPLSYIGVWKKFVEILEPRGYIPIKRYPCVARWNPTSEFTIASISAFQPFVITGEEEPPAKKLIIPQFCLRFNDIENVGITSAHATGFSMLGQHIFVSPDEWNQGQIFLDMHDFITLGVGLSKGEITIHEDSWAGGGSFGCSLEFFSRGVELFNQVYTMFEQTSKGPRELKLKVLDMGMGQERVAWFSQGKPNIYEATFPYVLNKLREKTEIDLDLDLYNRFSRFSAYLNADEVDDMDAAWMRVSKKLKIEVEELKNKILPMTGLYSIAEHARSLLFAIHDGKLPSNVGGGYNLRVIFRRAIGFVDKFKWKVEIPDVCEWHAEELKDLFPEVSENLNEIREILDVEKDKYYATKKKATKILQKELKKGKIDLETLIEMYDSNGISPDMIKEAAKRYDVQVKVPDNFYNLVVERHEQSEQIHATKKSDELDLEDVPETESLYYYDYTRTENQAMVLKIIEKSVILDKSVAYPTAGGQLHDIGTINGQIFKDVFKQGNHVIHILEKDPKFQEGDEVSVKVDEDWRRQLSQHHTATHIVNAAAQEILGNHVNQAGAKKTLETSHLDITHYEQLSNDQLNKIEQRANDIVNAAIDLNLKFMSRSDAEQGYGMDIYQGGAVPGSKIRIVEVPGVDVEACGGTHLNNTAETGQINIIKSQKIQDGVVRLVYTAGDASKRLLKKNRRIISELESFLGVKKEKILARVRELFEKWKNINKALSTGRVDEQDLELSSSEEFNGDLLTELSEFLNLPKDNILSKVNQFYEEWEEGKQKLDKMKKLLNDNYIEKLITNSIEYKGCKIVIEDFESLSQEDLKNLNQSILKEEKKAITILLNKNENGYIVMGMLGPKSAEIIELHLGNSIREIISHFGGKGGGSSSFFQGFIGNKDLDSEEIKSYIREEIKKI
ncbi:MAG: alanine--tRNA ligase, partial [Candidatus Lokiarchaeota archaeon]|nr:alanine--tRNA ligase [Candidatus Lokiarchaeota archaeon]MBD3199030.1 alanine--tRNA ligase [Candidatus Lokiarchaeota archaeon]